MDGLIECVGVFLLGALVGLAFAALIDRWKEEDDGV